MAGAPVGSALAAREGQGPAPAERPEPFVVVLTGGPSAGKSSAMAVLRDRLSLRGFQVLTVPENATHFLANSEGFQPEWAGATAQVAMQRIFLEYQLQQEEAFKDFARLHPSKPAVLLLDCCTLNSKVYLSDEQWDQALAFPGKPELTERELLGRYDLVIHMVTCAAGGEGHYEWGPGSNNPARYHSPEQAKDTDQRCLDVFGVHPQVRVVPHCPNFKDKIRKVLDFVNDALHVDGLAEPRRRRLACVTSVDRLAEVADQAGTSSSVITSTFLDEQMQHSVRRRVLVPRHQWLERFKQMGSSPRAPDADAAALKGSDVMYERRTHVLSPDDPSLSYMTRKVIQECEYYAALESAPHHATCGSAPGTVANTTKLVLSFVMDAHYYELFFFPDYRQPVLDLGQDAPVPPWLELVSADLPKEPALALAHQTPDKRAAKRPRMLSRYTTEEAAHVSYTAKMRQGAVLALAAPTAPAPRPPATPLVGAS